MDDVHQERVLAVGERGDRAVIVKAPDDDLTQPWAANVVDLCPVGALLSKDFLNKARAWELDRAASICTGCSQGCNITIETRDNAVVRVKPRGNADVNAFFMCDEGRLNYRWMNRQDRLTAPMANGAAASWEQAVETAAAALKGRRAHIVASGSSSNETFFLLAALARTTGGTVRFAVPTGAEAPLPGVADLALRADRVANATGGELLGAAHATDPYAGLNAGSVLVLVDVEPGSVPASATSAPSAVIYLGAVAPGALPLLASALPVCTVAESEGTLTNLRGRVQRFFQARVAPGHARPAWHAVADLLIALGERADYITAGDVFAALVRATPAFGGMSYDALGLKGAAANTTNATAPAARAMAESRR
jgi:NADH-quinone oxidoreductase subunit G